MPDYINYVAAAGDHVHFGMAEDPASDIIKLRATSPPPGDEPIDLVAGWIVGPKDRIKLIDAIKRELRGKPKTGVWITVPTDWAVELLRLLATAFEGVRWQVRKRPAKSKSVPTVVSRAVVTPRGTFPSVQAAAEAHGISRQAAWERANRRSPGWRFEDDASPQPARLPPGRPKRNVLTA